MNTLYPTKKVMTFRLATVCLAMTAFLPLFAQSKEDNDSEALDTFIKAQNSLGVVTFDSTNIKQYWINRTVISQNNLIQIYLENGNLVKNSVLLPIQLANVNETMDCKVSVVTEDSDISFSVFNSKSQKLSESSKEEDFIQDHIISSSFHLEKANDFIFNIKFSSNAPIISIKKIFLTLSANKDSQFLASPGILKASKEMFVPTEKTRLGENDFEISGVQSKITTQKNILVTDNTIKSTITVKNIGNTPSKIFIGYTAYTKNDKKMDSRNYPYKNSNKILHIVSTENEGKSIIVDASAECLKGCWLVQDAKEDLSDIPNDNVIGQVEEVKVLENGNMEIVLRTPLKNEIAKGTNIRVHGMGGSLIYMHSFTLNPGDEKTLTSSIQKDDSFLEYSTKALSRGIHYVKPSILTQTVGSTEENTILIKDYNITY